MPWVLGWKSQLLECLGRWRNLLHAGRSSAAGFRLVRDKSRRLNNSETGHHKDDYEGSAFHAGGTATAQWL